MKGGAGQVEGDTSPTVHPAYSDDPDADMIIQTTDNVQFKVPSYHLKAARYDFLYRGYGGLTRSTFFRSMPTKEDTPLSSAGEADTAVHIEAESDIFKILLDLVIHTDSTYADIVIEPLAIVSATLEVGRQLGFEQLPQKTLPFMHKFASRDPWGTFVFAARNDFPMLAAYAIDKLGSSAHYRTVTILNIDFSLFDGIPSKYFGPLIRNMTLFRTDTGATDWRKVSHNMQSLEDVSTGLSEKPTV